MALSTRRLRATVMAALVVAAAGFSLPAPALRSVPAVRLARRSQPRCSLQSAAAVALVAKAQKAAQAAPTLLSTTVATVSAVSATLWATAQGLPALVAISALVSLLGFIRYSWFFSLGYGLSMAAMAVLCMTQHASGGTLPTIAMVHSGLVLAWGIRLASFLANREFVAWPDARKRNLEMTKKTAFTAKLSTWIGVSIFDALLFSPVLFGIKTPPRVPVVAYVGIAAQVLGLAMEATADQQKSRHRKKTNTFVSGGLYKYSRHPNYLGEIIFWVGTYIAALTSFTGVLQWVAATLGATAILGVMIGATNGLDKRQVSKYMGTEGFEEYMTTTPKLVPFTGGDSLEKVQQALKVDEKRKGVTTTTTPSTSTYAKNKNPWDV